VLWVAGLAAALLLLLAVPVDVGFEVHRRERTESRVRIGWLWGRVRFPVSDGGDKAPRTKRPKRRRARKPGRPSPGRRVIAMARSPHFPRRALRLVRDLSARVRFSTLECSARLGLDDPADTGRLWGLLGPVAALLALPRAARVELSPEFGGALFHLDARGEARVVPAAVLVTVLAFLLAPATLRAAWAAARGTP